MKQDLESIIFETQKAEREAGNQNRDTIEKDKEINPELKELMEYSNEINKIVEKYDTLFFIEPKGIDGISYDKEFSSFFKKIEDHLDEEEYLSDDKCSEMCPTFTYPEIEEIDEKKLELKKVEEKIKKCENENASKKKCLRVFRGFDLKEEGEYLPKDTIYFRGEVEVSKMEQIEGGDKLEKYLRLSRVDPKFIPYLIKMNAYVDEKGLQMAKDVAKQIWQDKGWAVDYIKDKEWYEENTQMDRHWAYREDHMNENKTRLKGEE